MENKIFDIPFVRGVATVLPKNRMSVRDLKFDNSNVEEIIKVTGIDTVYQSSEGETLTDYCISAAEHLIAELNFDKSQIDGVVFSTLLGDYISPGSGYVVHGKLDLSERCLVVDINQACAGFVYGLFQAYMMIECGYCKNVLVCAGDAPSQTMHPKDKSLRTIMSDAGAAAIVSISKEKSPSAFSFFNEGQSLKALYIPAGGKRMPRKAGVTDVETTDKEGNVRTLEHPHMDGLEVTSFAIRAVPKTLNETLGVLNLTKDDIDVFALHQANELMLNALGKRLKVPAEKVPLSLKEYGNTACASVPITLCSESAKGKKFDKVFMCGFGNGLACAAATMSLKDTYFSGPHHFNSL